MKTKALISCAVTAQLIRGFVFAYAKCCFSCAVAHIVSSIKRRVQFNLIIKCFSSVIILPGKKTLTEKMVSDRPSCGIVIVDKHTEFGHVSFCSHDIEQKQNSDIIQGTLLYQKFAIKMIHNSFKLARVYKDQITF